MTSAASPASLQNNRVLIYNAEGQIVGQSDTLQGGITIPNAILWWPWTMNTTHTAYLYQFEVRGAGGGVRLWGSLTHCRVVLLFLTPFSGGPGWWILHTRHICISLRYGVCRGGGGEGGGCQIVGQSDTLQGGITIPNAILWWPWTMNTTHTAYLYQFEVRGVGGGGVRLWGSLTHCRVVLLFLTPFSGGPGWWILHTRHICISLRYGVCGGGGGGGQIVGQSDTLQGGITIPNAILWWPWTMNTTHTAYLYQFEVWWGRGGLSDCGAVQHTTGWLYYPSRHSLVALDDEYYTHGISVSVWGKIQSVFCIIILKW